MKFIKTIIVFGLGLVLGAMGGGYIGYHIGSADQRINTAPSAGVIAVQQVERPTEAAPAASTPNEPAPAEAAPPAPTTEEFIISPNDESQILWVGYKSVLGQEMSMQGGFANFEGKITVTDNDPNKSFVDLTIDTNLVFSSNTILTDVLKTDIFLNTQLFPKARFESTKIEPAENGYLVTGNFTMKDAVQGIQFPAVIERRDNGVYVAAEFKIDRKKWNVGYDSFEDSIILNDVVVSFEILAEPAK